MVSTGLLVLTAGDALLALIDRVVRPALIGVMINRDSRGHSYFIVRGGGAWPFLVGGAICLVNSVNERDLSLLTSYTEVILRG
ncbi:hypothetical protein V6N13_080987 [Hibiscus sabdariffa]